MLLALVSAAAFGCTICQYYGPSTPSNFSNWYAALEADRTATLRNISFTGGVFDLLNWTRTAYIQPQTHPYDRYFFDPERGNYTVQRYLADVNSRYGGIDALLIWPTYSNIGIDDRNQYDFFRTMPGGLAGVKAVTAELKAAGVRVLWPYNPWDTGTRRETPDSDPQSLARLLKATGGDGFNGDTMFSIPEAFWTAAAVQRKYPIALEPEDGGSDQGLNWATMGWGYWDFHTRIPIVDRFKWLTRGKFMTNACDRWAKNKTDHLHAAWFNGAGYESWENVWGVWNGIVPRDAEALRRVATMLRFLGGARGSGEDVLHSAGWVPHTPEVVQSGVYASKWPANPSPLPTPPAAATGAAASPPAATGRVLNAWTLVNRAGRNFAAPTAMLRVAASSTISRFFDCYAGAEIHPTAVIFEGGVEGGVEGGAEAEAGAEDLRRRTAGAPPLLQQLAFPIEAEGFGCVVEVAGAPSAALSAFLASMAALTRTPLRAYSKAWTYLPQVLVPIGRTPVAPRGEPPPAGDYVAVPYAPSYHFKVRSIQIEGDDAHGVDVQYPWEAHPQREHDHTLAVGPFYIDRFPVTNARYAAYLAATGYRPKDPNRWLARWNGSRVPPAAIADAPVTHVSLRESRLFCSWAGARLPHSWEWQYAAQRLDGRLYPWGATKNASNELPAFRHGMADPGPERVGAHSPQGDSPFGVSDMVGSVWQYTDEFRDDHTRAVILRGGSNYRPSGSKWYFPNAPELDVHNKYFLFDDAYERAGTIGFRCVVDAPSNTSSK